MNALLPMLLLIPGLLSGISGGSGMNPLMLMMMMGKGGGGLSSILPIMLMQSGDQMSQIMGISMLAKKKTYRRRRTNRTATSLAYLRGAVSVLSRK